MKYLVLGLGITGLSVVKKLVSEGHQVRVHDTRLNPPGQQELEQYEVVLTTGVLSVLEFHLDETIVISPGIPLATPEIAAARAAGAKIIGDIDLFCQRAEAPVIAITGSNAKSTVTTLVGNMAEACMGSVGVGGNLGVPVLELLNPEHKLYVLELSSYQLETVHDLKPVVSVILNISEDHMDRYDYQMPLYIAAKQHIHDQTEAMVINADDPQTWMPGKAVPTTRFSIHAPTSEQDFGIIQQDEEFFLAKGSDALLSVNDLPFRGLHNASNVLAALALCEAAGLPLAPCVQAVSSYHPLPHRCEFIANIEGVDWINDSKATNVGATLAALSGLMPLYEDAVLLLGGQGKGADFQPLAEALRHYPQVQVLVFGEDKADLLKALQGNPNPVESMSDELEKTLAHAGTLLKGKSKAAVILAPACASFDMFVNFEARGDAFRQWVMQKTQ